MVLCYYAVYQFWCRVCGYLRVVRSCSGVRARATCVGVPVLARHGGRRIAVGRRRQSSSERRGAAALSSRKALTRDPSNFVHWKLFNAISAGSEVRASLLFRNPSRCVECRVRAIMYALSRVYTSRSVYFWIFSKHFTAKFSKRSRSRVNGRSVCSTPASHLLCFCWRITFVLLTSSVESEKPYL